MKNPCWHCEKRTATCHAKCSEYAEFAEKCARIRKEREMENEVEDVLYRIIARREYSMWHNKRRESE